MKSFGFFHLWEACGRSWQEAPGPHTSNGRGGLGTDLQAGGRFGMLRQEICYWSLAGNTIYPGDGPRRLLSLSTLASFCVRITPCPCGETQRHPAWPSTVSQICDDASPPALYCVGGDGQIWHLLYNMLLDCILMCVCVVLHCSIL